jgi:hypothetical protein
LPTDDLRVGPFDPALLTHRWEHADPRVDELQQSVQRAVAEGEAQQRTRRQIFEGIWQRAHRAAGREPRWRPGSAEAPPRAAVPFLNEPWYC